MAPAHHGSIAAAEGRVTAIRLLLVEVDAALLTPEGQLTARTERAASLLREASIALAITSGRPPRGLRTLIASLAITTPISTFDGGRLVRPDLTTIEQHPLDDRVAEAVIPILERHGVDVWVYQDDEWLVRRTSAHVIREQAIMGLAPRIVERWTGVVRDAVKIVAISDDADAPARCEADLSSLCAHVTTVRSQPGHLDVMHPRSNKGEVARSLAKRLGIPIEALATIGGTPSDVHMFRESGLCIAMGHACAALQRQAHFITRSSSDEGFACAVETWVLPASNSAEPV
jgi:Cof subfamily protein (haloacid dehalogenase superfamily)